MPATSPQALAHRARVRKERRYKLAIEAGRLIVPAKRVYVNPNDLQPGEPTPTIRECRVWRWR